MNSFRAVIGIEMDVLCNGSSFVKLNHFEHRSKPKPRPSARNNPTKKPEKKQQEHKKRITQSVLGGVIKKTTLP
ncbi:hypothetical protein JTE90_021781 [Oedothorax gibbosus]|uniref:Uncharacterized protein n=1 Tax=Oedothorax gibbosus TaxID=931172 RepID=A0AAV6UR04_9ARAC|nr:hypothetical protein JTE90_021781 [Oedothorax gibbosus]